VGDGLVAGRLDTAGKGFRWTDGAFFHAAILAWRFVLPAVSLRSVQNPAAQEIATCPLVQCEGEQHGPIR
jgi:hypothetical protein